MASYCNALSFAFSTMESYQKITSRERGGGKCACACACVCWAIQQIRVVARSVQGHRPCVRRSFRSSWSTRQAAACTGTSHPSVLTKHTKSTQRAPCRNGRSETRGEHSLHMFVGVCVCVCVSVCLSVCLSVCVCVTNVQSAIPDARQQRMPCCNLQSGGWS